MLIACSFESCFQIHLQYFATCPKSIVVSQPLVEFCSPQRQRLGSQRDKHVAQTIETTNHFHCNLTGGDLKYVSLQEYILFVSNLQNRMRSDQNLCVHLFIHVDSLDFTALPLRSTDAIRLAVYDSIGIDSPVCLINVSRSGWWLRIKYSLRL